MKLRCFYEYCLDTQSGLRAASQPLQQLLRLAVKRATRRALDARHSVERKNLKELFFFCPDNHDQLAFSRLSHPATKRNQRSVTSSANHPGRERRLECGINLLHVHYSSEEELYTSGSLPFRGFHSLEIRIPNGRCFGFIGF